MRVGVLFTRKEGSQLRVVHSTLLETNYNQVTVNYDVSLEWPFFLSFSTSYWARCWDSCKRKEEL